MDYSPRHYLTRPQKTMMGISMLWISVEIVGIITC